MLGLLEVKLNDHMLYQKDFMADNPFLQTAIHFHTPIIELGKNQTNHWGEKYKELGLRAPTTLVWHNSDFFWSFNISLFGFGISVAYQNGY